MSTNGHPFGHLEYPTPPEKISDQTVRRRWEQAAKVNIKGERVSIDPDGPLAQAQWAKTRCGIAAQTLPHGYCGLPVQKSCPHANACLTCPVFLTGPEFLPELREHRSRTLNLIERAEHSGHSRVAEMNNQVLANLDRMIGEVAQHDQPGTAHAGLTTHTTSCWPHAAGPNKPANAPSPLSIPRNRGGLG